MQKAAAGALIVPDRRTHKGKHTTARGRVGAQRGQAVARRPGRGKVEAARQSLTRGDYGDVYFRLQHRGEGALSGYTLQPQFLSRKPPSSESLRRRTIPPFTDKRAIKSFIRTNEKIRAREIRVIDDNGEQLGIMAPFDALKIARERSLDLVEISPNATPPVCRIQDYGKYLYEKDKSERAARKKQKVITIKEVKFSVTVDEHDYQTKKNQAVRFLGEGDKVKASLRFRGRQMAHRDLGYKIINRLIMDIGPGGIVEFMPRMEGTTLHAIIAPTKKQEPQAPAAPKKSSAPAPAAVQETANA